MHEQPAADTQRVIKIQLQSGYGRDIAIYSEQEITQYSQVDITIIQQLTEVGLLGSHKAPEEEFYYTDKDLSLLRKVHRLYHDLDINTEGIEVILRLTKRIEELHQELSRYTQQATATTQQPDQ
jgi:MerR family transcriptional regulator, heat shock protein HspR